MKSIKIISFTLLFIILASCQRKTYEYVYPALNDGRYDSEFPYRNCSEQLSEIAKSVIKIVSLTGYTTYHFHAEEQYSKYALSGIAEDSLLRKSTHTTNKFDATNGSATIIHYDNGSIVLMTCAHVIHSPDTLYTFYDDLDPETPDYLAAVSVKNQHRLFFTGYVHGENLNVLAIDRDADLALIGKRSASEPENLKAVSYPLGSSDELEWGSFVYIMGYPLGYQMITRGIVSKPARKKSKYFLIDASFNQGFSGGIVLAIKDGVPNFEIVGLGKSASATYENIIIPEKRDYEKIYNSEVPYEGDLFVELRKNVNYGITKAVSSETIRDFYRKNRDDLKRKGFDLDYFFLGN